MSAHAAICCSGPETQGVRSQSACGDPLSAQRFRGAVWAGILPAGRRPRSARRVCCAEQRCLASLCSLTTTIDVHVKALHLVSLNHLLLERARIYIEAAREPFSGVFPRGLGQVKKVREQIKAYVAGQLAACTEADPDHPQQHFKVWINHSTHAKSILLNMSKCGPHAAVNLPFSLQI